MRHKRVISKDKDVIVEMDATYWGRYFGIVVIKDALRNKVLWYKFIRSHERIEDYVEGIDWLKSHGFRIWGIVCDGLRGLFEAFRPIPVQMCQFHMVSIVRRYLTTPEQRSQIFALLQRTTPRKEIARIVGCSEATISRELKRNSTEKGNYLRDKARAKAMARRKRTTSNKKLDDMLVWRIKEMLRQDWSPEQIRGVLAGENTSVSIQTIYNIINADTTGELMKHRRHPNFKRRQKGEHKPAKATNIANRTSIHDRPEEADGTRFGDWEMDLIVDSCGHAILVLLDRLTGFVLLERLKHGKKAKPLAKVVIRLLFGYRKYLKTITTDNGSEFAAHLDITAGLRMKGLPDVTVSFADSYCSWQKGAVENVNKLIRQYIPKKSNFNDFSDEYIKNVGRKLNLRPRKRLGFSSPKKEFFKQIANFALAC